MTTRIDTPEMRKSRGAFFTPVELVDFITTWAIRDRSDKVLEPSCGDAIFLRSAGRRLRHLGCEDTASHLTGHDIHRDSLEDARILLAEDGLAANLVQGDFFDAPAGPRSSAVVGNPPFIRFQGFTGQSRRSALHRSSEAGVDLSGLASSWAAFVIHGSSFLIPGGRLGLVLPAELLSVNYAGPVRRFLLERFASVDLIVFDELVFAGVQADVVVLLADGYRRGSTTSFKLHSVKNVASITTSNGRVWSPTSPSGRWTDALAPNDGASILDALRGSALVPLESWGRATSGIVTGANAFFTMTRKKAHALGLTKRDLLPVLPAGSSFGGRAALTRTDWSRTTETRPGYLFAPGVSLSKAAKEYILEGEGLGVQNGYKCRVREPWWRVPLNSAPDFFVSYMSGTTPRIVTNSARVLNLNSVHGLRVTSRISSLARSALPIMAMSSASLLSAELVGRSYGGGVLKMEPREASQWLVPSPETMARTGLEMVGLLSRGRKLLNLGDVDGCTAIADEILVLGGEVGPETMHIIRETRLDMVKRRATRAASRP